MKKVTKNNCLFMLFVIACATITLVGCKNSDYDFDNVDKTLGFGVDKLMLPTDNSVNMVLDDLLDIDNSDLISTNENGDYLFGKNPEPIDPVSVTIDPISKLGSTSEPASVHVDVSAVPQEYVGQEIDLEEKHISVEPQGKVSEFNKMLEVPEAVKDLDVIGLGDEGELLVVDLQIPSSLVSFSYIDIDLPKNLVMTWENPMNNGTFADNHLHLSSYTSTGHLTLTFKVTQIKKGRFAGQNESFVDFVPAASAGEKGTLSIRGTVSMAAKVRKLRVTGESVLSINGTMTFGDLEVKSVTGVFDPDINLTTAGTVHITSIPQFLTDEEVVADLDNPQIYLTIRSTMPLDGKLKVQLKSDTYQDGIVFNDLFVKKSPDGETETETHILLCRHRPSGDFANVQILTNDNLSKLVNKLKEGMQVEFSVLDAKAVQETGTVLLAHEYHVTPSYKFSAPLAFGPKAVIVYSKTEDGLNDDIDDLALDKNSYIHVKGTAVNRIPADLELELTPIDIYGNDIPKEELEVQLIHYTVKGTRQEAVESPVEARLIDPKGTGIRKLDGIRLKLKARSNEELRGVTLNKTSQALKLKDLSVELVGKIVYDAN